MKHLLTVLLAFVLAVPAFAGDLGLPQQLAGKVTVLQASDPDYPRAVLGAAIKPPGEGGIYAGLVVKTKEDLTVYRLWNGPLKKDKNGNTNRLGSWWSYDPPQGDVGAYRTNYEVCVTWNDLTWVANCTLKSGAVVAIGPGQSVSARTCQDPSGTENYPASPSFWQLYIDKPWTRLQELICPDQTSDYEANPMDISKQKQSAGLARLRLDATIELSEAQPQ